MMFFRSIGRCKIRMFIALIVIIKLLHTPIKHLCFYVSLTTLSMAAATYSTFFVFRPAIEIRPFLVM